MRRPMLKPHVEDTGIGWGEGRGVSQVSFAWVQILTWILPSHQSIVKGQRKIDTIYITHFLLLHCGNENPRNGRAGGRNNRFIQLSGSNWFKRLSGRIRTRTTAFLY